MPRARRHTRRTPSTGARSDDASEARSGAGVRSRRAWLLAGGGLLVAMLLTLGAVGSCIALSGSSSDEPPGPPKAVIVDQLSLTIGVSIGMAHVLPGESPSLALRRADQSMYETKSSRAERRDETIRRD